MILFIGTYTHGGTALPLACGKGIMSCTFDPASGRFSNLQCEAKVVNPSWLHFADQGQRLFAVSERFDQPGQVHGFDVTDETHLTHRSSQSSHGLATCHVAATRDHLYAASYLDGRLARLPRQQARVQPSDAVIEYVGAGPSPQRQKNAHVHQAVVAPHGRWLYVCDLGSDRIWQHDLSSETVLEKVGIAVPPGAGPRHLIFHPTCPKAWVVCELTPMILSFDWEAWTGSLKLRDTLVLNDVPQLAHVGATAAIHLHPSGQWLGISDRSDHAICLFAVEKTGAPKFEQRLESDEKTPRDFAFSPDGRWLIVAWQDSHALTSHAIRPDLRVARTPSDRLEVHSPVCAAMR